MSKGLIVDDDQDFYKTLNRIGYYRLKGYMHPFLMKGAQTGFKPQANFSTILAHYHFDKLLRSLLMDSIETIEVALRAKLTNAMATTWGAHWYLDNQLFYDRNAHADLISEIREACGKSSETFVHHYRSKYTQPELPPSWMMTELLTFGQLCNLFENLRDNDEKKTIPASLQVVSPIFSSWLKSLNFVRNCCAHHTRLWNCRLPLKPRIPTRKQNRFLMHVDDDTDKNLFGILSCMVFLLKAIQADAEFKKQLKKLFHDYPEVNIAYMGFQPTWLDEEIWR